MQHGDGERRDPFQKLAEEPRTAPGSEVMPAVLARPPTAVLEYLLMPAWRRRKG